MNNLVRLLLGLLRRPLSAEARLIVEDLQRHPHLWRHNAVVFGAMHRGAFDGGVRISLDKHRPGWDQPPLSKSDWEVVRKAAVLALVVRSISTPEGKP